MGADFSSRPRPTRNAPLMDLATELAAFVFNRLLGFSGQTAATWRAERSGDDARYVAYRAPGTAGARPPGAVPLRRRARHSQMSLAGRVLTSVWGLCVRR